MMRKRLPVILLGGLILLGCMAGNGWAHPADDTGLAASDETSVAELARTDTPSSAVNGQAMGLLIFVFVLAIFLGIELISKVPSQLHTPLMSGSNAISGISVVGAMIAAGMGHSVVMTLLGTLAVTLAMINVVGGYLVTDRMLGMFKHKEKDTP